MFIYSPYNGVIETSILLTYIHFPHFSFFLIFFLLFLFIWTVYVSWLHFILSCDSMCIFTEILEEKVQIFSRTISSIYCIPDEIWKHIENHWLWALKAQLKNIKQWKIKKSKWNKSIWLTRAKHKLQGKTKQKVTKPIKGYAYKHQSFG